MAKYSKQTYERIFDQMLEEELYFSSFSATENNILTAMKRVLGRTIKSGHILMYSDLSLDESLGVHFKIKDPDEEIIQIKLTYGPQ